MIGDIYEATFDNIVIGILEVKQSGQIKRANAACESIWGYPIDTLPSMTIKDLTRHDSDDPNSDFIETSMKRDEKAIFEKNCYHKNGHEITCEVSYFLIADKENGTQNLVYSVRDITKQNRRNKNLISRLHYEKNLVRFSNALMLEDTEAITKGLHYLLIASKSSRVYIFENFIDEGGNLSMKQTHETCAEGVDPEIDNPQLQHIIYDTMGFERWRGELSQNKIINGIVADFNIQEREILEPQGIKSILIIPLWVGHKWFGFIGFDDIVNEKIWQQEDINLLRTASEFIGVNIENQRNKNLLIENNEQLKEAIATKDRFLSILGHDLKGHFRSVLGFSELLHRNIDDYDNEKIKTFSNTINSSLKQTYNLLENLLEWSRSQQNRIPFNPQSSNLLLIVEETCLLQKNAAKAKHIDIEINIPADINILVDIEMIKTVIRNLLNNAIKYTDVNGKVSVSARHKEGSIELVIADTGIGMSKATLDSLFKISEISSITGTAGEQGTGFGLLLCKEFIDEHQGSLIINSELGKGSRFTIILPTQE